MKLSILKWVYDLGYKKAEDRYYFALMEQARFVGRDLQYAPLNEPEKQRRQREEMLKARQRDLENVINVVFQPQDYVEVLPKDRFLP